METGAGIPLMIGVTGHVNLRKQDEELLRETVKRELVRLGEKRPHTPLKMLSSLAAGADLLCAEAAEQLGIPLAAVLPMPPGEYERDFGPDDSARFRHQLGRAETVFTPPPAEAVPEVMNRDFLYRQAGIFVAEHSHLLLALWDGEQDSGSACGTAAAVDFALKGAFRPKRGLPVRFRDNILVLHIRTPREGDQAEAGAVRLLGEAGKWEEIADRTEEFNRLAESEGGEDLFPLPEEEAEDAAMGRLNAVYRKADRLSLDFSEKYRRSLAVLALAGTVVTFTFLLYDNGEMIPMILAAGAALLYAVYRRRKAVREACHRRFIEYRALAEKLRVQMFLRRAGSTLEVQRLMTWSQRHETPWVLCAVSALNAAPPPEKSCSVRECWVEKQRDYHRKAGRKSGERLKRSEGLLGIALRASVLLYGLILLYELLCGGVLIPAVLPVRNPETGRTVLKILLGTLSAGTLFLAGYYGKMSLRRVNGDDEKMARFYEMASEQLALEGQHEEILESLAREELTENGNWVSYQRDNEPELNL